MMRERRYREVGRDIGRSSDGCRRSRSDMLIGVKVLRTSPGTSRS